MSFDCEGLYIATGTFDGTDNPATVDIPRYAQQHQIAVQGAVGATGTLALTAVPFGKTDAEEVLDESGTQVVIDLAAEGVVVVDGVYTAFVFTPTAVSDDYTVTIIGLK